MASTLVFKDKLEKAKYLFVFVIFYSALSVYFDSSNYENSYSATKKSLNISPNSVALMTSHLYSTKIYLRSRGSDPVVFDEYVKLEAKIKNICAIEGITSSSNSMNCYQYLNDHYEKYRKIFPINSLVKLSGPLTFLSAKDRLFIKSLNLNVFENMENLDTSFIDQHYFQFTKSNRLDYWKFFCFKKDLEKARFIIKNFLKKKLLSTKDIETYRRANVIPEVDWTACI